MFRTQANAFDDIVAKATDENLTSENWEYMMDAWERVNNGGENAPKDAVAALIKRLAHRNANVQLYTLELANAFSQNCGPPLQRELASRAFTDALLRLAGDRNTHAAVKTRVLGKMAEWTECYKHDTDLGIMEQAYARVKSANPNLHPPSKPTKREITDVDRQKEEEELQMALAISLKEKSAQASAGYKPAAASSSSSALAPGAAVAVEAAEQATLHTTAATVSRVRALYDFVPTEAGELAFRKGDIIAVLESVYKDWWKGSLRGQTGIFPLNYVEKLSDPTSEELQKDAQMEAEVFGQIKNVEKLLALLSTSDGAQESEEITTLYHSTLTIRPKLIELIGKYSQKKDDFVALNEKFIKARRDYESLLESSMSQGAAAHYGRPPVSSNPYNYPPAENNYQEPSRYYNTAPNPQGSASPQNVQGGFPPPQQQQQRRPNPNQYYPQEDHNQANPNPVPFYVVAGGGPPPSSPLPDASSPQELATNIYDTPADTIHEAAFIEPPPQQQQQPYYQPYQHRPPYPPTIDGAPSPISPQAPYPVLQQQEAGAAPSYQGYTRPPPGPGGAGYYTAGQQQPQQPQPQQQGPQDYYRTGTGGNELFLPNGSRAQGA